MRLNKFDFEGTLRLPKGENGPETLEVLWLNMVSFCCSELRILLSGCSCVGDILIMLCFVIGEFSLDLNRHAPRSINSRRDFLETDTLEAD